MNGTTPPEGTSTGPASDDPREIEAHIERTRQDLATTIDALGAKLDVRSRAEAKLRQAREAATDERGRPTPATLAVTVAVLALVGGLVVLRRRR